MSQTECLAKGLSCYFTGQSHRIWTLKIYDLASCLNSYWQCSSQTWHADVSVIFIAKLSISTGLSTVWGDHFYVYRLCVYVREWCVLAHWGFCSLRKDVLAHIPYLFIIAIPYLFSSLVFWAQSTTRDYMSLKTNSAPSLSYSAHKSFDTNNNISAAR